MNIEETKQRMREVLQETIDYYDSPEKFGYSKEKDHCVYLDEQTGAMCAFGRCAVNPNGLPQKQSAGIEDIFVSNQDIDEVLKEKYRGLPMDFWNHLQGLHDNSSRFSSIKDGLIGSGYVRGIHRRILELIEEYGSEAS
jgi:hypothetical protein